MTAGRLRERVAGTGSALRQVGGSLKMVAKTFVGTDRLVAAGLVAMSFSRIRPRAKRLVALGIRAHGVRKQVLVRFGAADAEVLREVFIEEVYDWPYERYVDHVEHVLDLGAHVGLASSYFASRFPDASVVAVEPLDENFALLERNAAADPRRIIPMSCAVAAVGGSRVLFASSWSSSGTLTPVVADSRRAITSRPESRFPYPPREVRALSVPEIMTAADMPRIDVLKLDIEGAEVEVLGHGPDWLELVGVVVVEHHYAYVDPAPVRDALADAGFVLIGAPKGRVEAYARPSRGIGR